MLKLLKWLDDNILLVLSGFLLIFIPLYPKLPLMEALPGYIVRIRLEDFFVSFCILLFLLWVIRGKIKLSDNPLLFPILAYLAIGFISMVSAIFIIQTVPKETLHVGKIFLHFLRRIEYFSLFFIFYSATRSIKLVKTYTAVLIIAAVAVAIYGFGQKYLYWPAFSTMNREYSKGWMLYLTRHARVLSTFGGHYDLAAFIMMVLVLLWSLFFGIKKWFLKLLVLLPITVSFWTLILTASRTSFIAYIFGVSFTFFLWTYKKGIKWSFVRWGTVVFLSILVMLSFGDLSERFTKFLRIDEKVKGIKSLLLSPIGKPPVERAIFLENNPQIALSMITAKSDQPPSYTRPSDVYQDIPLDVTTDESATVSAQRTYSRTAFMFDLSTAIRFDALWPMAIAGFAKSPILGSGYSTLNRTQPGEFTEAESTDNDYLRSLGETGILGFISFFGTLCLIIYIVWRNLAILKDPVMFSLSAGLGGLLFGLLVNGIYIDVFEASKVAFLFWAIAGFILAGINIVRQDRKKPPPAPRIPGFQEFKKSLFKKTVKFLKSDLFFLICISTLAFCLRLYKINSPLADWHSWRQADTSAVTRNYVREGINILYPTYDDLSNVASGKDNPRGFRFVEFPLYNVASVVVDKIFVGHNIEFSGRMTSILASLGSITFLFLIVRKYLGRKEAVLASILYAVLPYNIFYTRVILPEPFLVFTSLGMIWFFDKWIEKNLELRTKNLELKKIFQSFIYFLLAYIFTASSLLIKPFAAFLFLPMAYLWFKRFKFSTKSVIKLLSYFLISLFPFLWWRYFMVQFPEGIPSNMWLFNGDRIRFKGAFFYWLFAERLSKLILGYWGVPLLIFGIISQVKKEGGWLFNWWGISMLLYVTVVATGNVRHDYYQIITIPIIVVFLAKGIVYMLERSSSSGLSASEESPPKAGPPHPPSAGFRGVLSLDCFKNVVYKLKIYSLIVVIILFMEMFGWYHIRDFYNINHPEIVEAGQAVERETHDKTLVIAPYNGDTAFLYQTRRAGWPVMQEGIEEMVEKGAHYFVSVNFDDLTKQLIEEATDEDLSKRKYKLIELTDKYVIIQLVPDNKLPK